MFREKDEIPNDFNGTISLEQEDFFFDIKDNILRIFFNKDGVSSVRDFEDKYWHIIKNRWLFGMCPDKRRIAFIIQWKNYSSYPDKYAEFAVSTCIKEVYYSLKSFFDFAVQKLPYKEREKKEKFEHFNLFDGIRISGSLIDSIYPQSILAVNIEGQFFVENELVSTKQKIVYGPIEIQLTEKSKANFSIVSEMNQGVNGVKADTKMEFLFKRQKDIKDFPKLFIAIKRFVDLMVKAKNTKFSIELLQEDSKELIRFAEVKMYDAYKNYCNKEWTDVIRLSSLQDNIPTIFNNLIDEKYSLCFLPIDNDDYGSITYSSVQNMTTAIELACNMKGEFQKIRKEREKSGQKIKDAEIPNIYANIIYSWYKKYLKLIRKNVRQNLGFGKPMFYTLTANKIKKFREVRHDIVHRGVGRIDHDCANCYQALKSVFYYYILDVKPNETEYMVI